MADAAKIVKDLAAAFSSNSPDFSKCQALVNSFKLSLLKLPITVPVDTSNAEVREHLLTARQGYELAVLVSLHQKDLQSFELNFSQLKPYYFDYASVLPESPKKWPILGLQLLKLLAQSRIAEFHTELELLPIPSHKNEFIAYPITLEQELMEGSYRALWDASFSVPFPEYKFFVDFLVNAARDNIAECAEKAYQHLSVKDALKLLKLPAVKELQAFCSNRGWQIKDETIQFRNDSDQTFYIPAQELMKHTLGYATELERIV